MSQSHPIQRLSFNHGFRWLPAAADIMARHIGPIIGIAAIWLLVSMVAVMVPVVGQLFLIVFTPLLTAGILIAFDQIGQGLRPRPTTLFEAWKEPLLRYRLILVGLFSLAAMMAAAMVIVAWMTAQLGAETLESLAGAEPEVLVEALVGTSFGPGLFLAAAIFALALAAVYFAIPLIAFGRWGVARSLGYSLKAMVINWLAMLGFGVALFLVLMAFMVIAMVLMAVLSLALGEVGAMLAQIPVLIGGMAIQVLTIGAQYLAFCQIFGWTPGPEEDTRTPPSQDPPDSLSL